MLMRGLRTLASFLRKYRIWVMLSVIALLIFTYQKRGITLAAQIPSIMPTADDSLKVFNLLLNTGLNEILSRYATAQSAFETGGFTSDLLKSNNNLFGMKYGGQVNSIGEKNGYANYSDYAHSVADFVAWYSRKRSSIFSLPLYINSLASYVRFLKNNSYFEAVEADYLAGVTSWYNRIFDTK